MKWQTFRYVLVNMVLLQFTTASATSAYSLTVSVELANCAEVNQIIDSPDGKQAFNDTLLDLMKGVMDTNVTLTASGCTKTTTTAPAAATTAAIKARYTYTSLTNVSKPTNEDFKKKLNEKLGAVSLPTVTSATVENNAAVTTTTTTVSVVQTQTVKTTATVKVDNCATVRDMSKDAGVKRAFVQTMAEKVGVGEADVKCDVTPQNCNTRRLQAELIDSTRRRLADPSIQAAYSVSVPPGKSVTETSNSVSSIKTNAFQDLLVNNLAGTNFSNTSVTVSSITAPTTSMELSGYKACYSKQACYIYDYVVNLQYVIHSSKPVDLVTCGQACANAGAGCEAFEHINVVNAPTCVFWKAGACNIPRGNPPGFVSDVKGVTTCEKDGTRSAFTPIASKCPKKSILGIVSVLLWAFLMSEVTA